MVNNSIRVVATCLALLAPNVEARIDVVHDERLPGNKQVQCADALGDLVFIGRTRGGSSAELTALDVSDPSAPRPVWEQEIRGSVNALAIVGETLYAATGANRAELLVIEPLDGAIVAALDLPGPRDATEIASLGRGLLLQRNTGGGDDAFLIDIRDRGAPRVATSWNGRVLEEGPEATGVPDHVVPNLAVRVDRPGGPGTMLHLLFTRQPVGLEILRRDVVRFPDNDGDGVFRLGCLGDSNTFGYRGLPRSWCVKLRDTIDDPFFEVVLIAAPGATANPQTIFDQRLDAAHHLESAIAYGVDAVLLAYGTNDLQQGYTPDEIALAYQEHRAVAEAAGVDFYVASTPGRLPDPGADSMVVAVNQILAATFPERLVDFFSGFGPELYRDRLHFTERGQALRAERAYEVLGPLR